MSSVVLATAGYDHTIRFWEATSGICYRTLQYAESQVNKLEITSEKQYIAAAGNSHVRLFEVNSNDPQPVISYEGHQGNVTAVGFQKDSKWMYTGWRHEGVDPSQCIAPDNIQCVPVSMSEPGLAVVPVTQDYPAEQHR